MTLGLFIFTIGTFLGIIWTYKKQKNKCKQK